MLGRSACYGRLCILLGKRLRIGVISITKGLIGMRSVHTPHTFTAPRLFNSGGLLPTAFATDRSSMLLVTAHASIFGLVDSMPSLLRHFLYIANGYGGYAIAHLHVLSCGVLHDHLICCFVRRGVSPSATLLRRGRIRLTRCLKIAHPTLSGRVGGVVGRKLVSVGGGMIALRSVTTLGRCV